MSFVSPATIDRIAELQRPTVDETLQGKRVQEAASAFARLVLVDRAARTQGGFSATIELDADHADYERIKTTWSEMVRLGSGIAFITGKPGFTVVAASAAEVDEEQVKLGNNFLTRLTPGEVPRRPRGSRFLDVDKHQSGALFGTIRRDLYPLAVNAIADRGGLSLPLQGLAVMSAGFDSTGATVREHLLAWCAAYNSPELVDAIKAYFAEASAVSVAIQEVLDGPLEPTCLSAPVHAPVAPAASGSNGWFESLVDSVEEAGLQVEPELLQRVCAALLARRFIVLSGLSGSGKTQVAMAIARWFSGAGIDPLVPGTKIESARVSYFVQDADRISVEFANSQEEGSATRVVLPRALIAEWVAHMEDGKLDDQSSARAIREVVAERSQFSNQLHSFETHLKAAALHVLRARARTAQPPSYEVVAVGADWVGSDRLLGYASALDPSRYHATPTLRLILQAVSNPDIPHFLILDEMNLSHVERYFADLLSALESGQPLQLHGADFLSGEGLRVPGKVKLPDNLFIIGTVNVDETTYMFSPKVLDRAHVIEFRMPASALDDFLEEDQSADLSRLDSAGTGHVGAFMSAARSRSPLEAKDSAFVAAELRALFSLLQRDGREFGFRVAEDARRFFAILYMLAPGMSQQRRFDYFIAQRILPKLNGSRAKLGPILESLWGFCMLDASVGVMEGSVAGEPGLDAAARARYPLSAEKIFRIWRQLQEHGFGSFAEA
jgi:MoxR-like ATPase